MRSEAVEGQRPRSASMTPFRQSSGQSYGRAATTDLTGLAFRSDFSSNSSIPPGVWFADVMTPSLSGVTFVF